MMHDSSSFTNFSSLFDLMVSAPSAIFAALRVDVRRARGGQLL